MTRRIAHVGVVFLVLYGLLFFRLEIIQVLNADTLRSHPQNTREITLVFDCLLYTSPSPRDRG